MKLLILGATGMLGHKLLQRLSTIHETVGAIRGAAAPARLAQLIGDVRILCGVDAARPESMMAALDNTRPDAVINCIGVIKQIKEAHDPIVSLEINSLLPHRLARACAERGARLIHFSTDCVFSGKTGKYTEQSESDATDLYGRSKFLGETAASGALTIRSSIIGHEISTAYGLIEWFLTQRGGRIKGFDKAIYTGLTTGAMADVVLKCLEATPTLDGLWQVSSEGISKYELLGLVNEAYGARVTIDRDQEFDCDRSLNSARFRAHMNWTPPSWPAMIEEMRDDWKRTQGAYDS